MGREGWKGGGSGWGGGGGGEGNGGDGRRVVCINREKGSFSLSSSSSSHGRESRWGWGWGWGCAEGHACLFQQSFLGMDAAELSYTPLSIFLPPIQTSKIMVSTESKN